MSEAILGSYRLIAELGHGGMADVYLAVSRGPAGFSKLVVIKRLRQSLVEDAEFVTMLVDEARIAGRLNHPNVVQTNEVAHVGEHYFIAMEYLEGQPLHRVLHRSSRLHGFPLPMHLRVITDALAGLHHAHDLRDYDGTPLNVVHRDATPQNVFVTYDGQVKVVDFGIAKAAGRSSETKTGIIKGKVSYMAPEQAIGSDVDRRADVFSVGIMLWEAATGRRLWRGCEDLVIMQRLIAGDIPYSPRTVNPDVSPELDKIVQKAIAFNPEDRFATAAEFQNAVEEFIDSSRQKVTSRELGDYVSDLFKDRRAQQRAVIERQLAELKLMSTDQFASVAVDSAALKSSFTPSGIPNLIDSHMSSRTGGAVSTGGGAKFVQTQDILNNRAASAPEGFRRRSRLAGFVATGAALAVAVGWAAASLRPPPAPAASVPERAPTSSAAAVRTAPPATVKVTVRAAPIEAQFRIDGGSPVTNPFTARFPRDGQEHKIEVFAPGYLSVTRTITFSEDSEMELSLEKDPSLAPKPAPRPRTPVAAATAAPAASPAPRNLGGKPPLPIDTDNPL